MANDIEANYARIPLMQGDQNSIHSASTGSHTHSGLNESSSSEDIPLQDIISTKTNLSQDELVERPNNERQQEQTLSSSSSFIQQQVDSDFFFWNDNSVKGKFARFFYLVWNGPVEPVDNPPTRLSFLEPVEELPHRFKQNVSKPIRIGILLVYLSCWALLAHQIIFPYLTTPPNGIDGSLEVIPLSCGNEPYFWKGNNAKCGLNGELCPNFETNEAIFRCPALCDRGSWTFSYIPLGDQLIKYRGYFVGGGDTTKTERKEDSNKLSKPYRADSYICGAAIHAGVISPFFGGCSKVSYVGSQLSFPSTKGHYGVENSLSFNSFFPSSFIFNSLPGPVSNCYDPRFFVLVFNILLGIPIIFFASGCVAYWTISIVGFWTIILATDPPKIVDAKDPETLSRLISIGLERFLPSCFILYVLWHCSVRRTLQDPDPLTNMKPSPLSKLVLWFPLFWLGVLNNMTFDRLPVDRLTLHDLKTQPGALTAVGSIIITIAACAVVQTYKIWQSGRFKKYLCIYVSLILSLVILGNLSGLTLRVHHYILAMLLIPGCATRGFSAMLFQGILLGLFLSGAARWGLASIAETATTLRRADPSGKLLPPTFIGFDNDTKILSWENYEKVTIEDQKLKGFSLLINDIERYKGPQKFVNFTQLMEENNKFSELVTESLRGNPDDDGNISLYVRVAKSVVGGTKYSDFTRAGILKWPSGDFIPPTEGFT